MHTHCFDSKEGDVVVRISERANRDTFGHEARRSLVLTSITAMTTPPT